MENGIFLAQDLQSLKAYETGPAHWLRLISAASETGQVSDTGRSGETGKTRKAGADLKEVYDCMWMQTGTRGIPGALKALDDAAPDAVLPEHERRRLLWLQQQGVDEPADVFVHLRRSSQDAVLKALAGELHPIEMMAASGISHDTLTVGAGAAPIPDGTSPDGTGKTTVVPGRVVFQRKAIFGIIDDEIGFLNTRFCTRGEDGALRSRIEGIWRQSDPRLTDVPSGSGSVIDKAQIDAMLAEIAAGRTDEATVYGQMPARRLAERGLAPVTHGTHVMDLAAGFDPEDQPDISIFAVDMPSIALEAPSHRIGAPYLVQGLRWLIQAALAHVQRLNQSAVPDENGTVVQFVPDIVLNCSIGSFAGPKDGSSGFARLIGRELDLVNAMTTDPALGPGFHYGATLFQSFGNAYANHQSAFHAGAALAGPVDWILPREDTASSTLEIRVSGAAVSRIWVRIGDVDLEVPALEPHSCQLIETPAGVIAGLYREAGEAGGRALYRLIVAPTLRLDQTHLPVMPAGAVRVAIEGEGPLHVLWQVQRDDVPFGYSAPGSQSTLRDPLCGAWNASARSYSGLAPASAILREGTETAEAHSPHPHIVTVGAALRGAADAAPVPSPYTASGSDNPAISRRTGPDVSATGDEPSALWGVLASGTYSGTVARLSGTSIAAPQAARRMLMTGVRPDVLPDVQAGVQAGVQATADASDVPASAQAGTSARASLRTGPRYEDTSAARNARNH